MTTTILSVLEQPYFDFLVLRRGECWESPGRLKKVCFHNPNALLVHDSTVHVFVDAFGDSHPEFNYFGPTEYLSENLSSLQVRLQLQLKAISSCENQGQFIEILPKGTTRRYERSIEAWPSKWEAIRDELAEQGRKILDLAERAQREDQALLVMGI
ncbi:MAG: hypothetical protein V4671_16890 [Armatimonadota bacterium]